MERTADFLNAIKARYGYTSDYQLSKALQLTTGAIGHYRAGRSKLDDAIALKVAELLDLDPGYVLACVHAERAKAPNERNAWIELAKRATVGLLMLSGLGAPTPAPAAVGDVVYYVKSRKRKKPRAAGSSIARLARAVARFKSPAFLA